MMQESTINGSLYKVYDSASQDYKYGRMPRVGQTCVDSLGRKFVFVSTAVDVAAGQTVSAPAASSEIATAFTAVTSGNTEVVVVLAGVTKNKYADGILVITESAGKKTSYSIKKNTAAAAVTNLVTLTLDVPLVANLAAADDCILVPNRHNLVVIGTATSSGVGVAINASTAAADSKTNYMWVQTYGPGAVKVGTGAGVTKGLTFGLDAAGVVNVVAAVTTVPVGYSLAEAAVSNDDSLAAFLMFPC